jgi:hypothetical protein
MLRSVPEAGVDEDEHWMWAGRLTAIGLAKEDVLKRSE